MKTRKQKLKSFDSKKKLKGIPWLLWNLTIVVV
jgi:hypothetical protein